MNDRTPESVWRYPRPPVVEPVAEEITIELAGEEVVRSHRAVRVLETSHPPTYYVPKDDVADGVLEPNARRTLCEYKGQARYYDVVVADRRAPAAAWEYAEPKPGYEAIAGCVSFYAAAMDACFVGGERVESQAGDFYGGWITSWIEGPFKGGPGTRGW